MWLGTALILRRKIPLELGNLANLAHLFLSDYRLSGYMRTSLLGRLNMDSSDLCGLPFCRGSVPSARSATSATHRVRAMPAQARGLLDHLTMLAVAVPDSQHCHRAASPRAYFATMALLYHRPSLMIAESGALARSIRRASPTRPLWPENHSPKPAARAAALTRRLIVLAVITKTDELALTWSCWISVQVGHGPAGDEHHFVHAGLLGCAPLNEQLARSVVSVFDVGPDEGGDLRAAQIAVPKRQHQGCVHHAPPGSPPLTLHAPAIALLGRPGRCQDGLHGVIQHRRWSRRGDRAVRTTGLLTARRNPGRERTPSASR